MEGIPTDDSEDHQRSSALPQKYLDFEYLSVYQYINHHLRGCAVKRALFVTAACFLLP
jgi:hypothetical protein